MSKEVIYLIRHAEPDWDRTDLVYYHPPGPPLSMRGISEAGLLGAYLEEVRVRRLFVSPLERCQHTAEIIAATVEVVVHVEEGLIEWQPGEDALGICRRIWPVFEKACKTSVVDGGVGLVTHGGPIAVLLDALGMDEATLESWRRFDHGNPLPTGGVWEAVHEDMSKKWRLNLSFTPDFIDKSHLGSA